MKSTDRRFGSKADQQLFADAAESVLPPDGVELRSNEERVIWHQFTKVRTKSDWRDFDLVILAKVVRLEADIRKYQKKVDSEGPTVTNARGTPVTNPMLTALCALQSQQLALIRNLSLSQSGSDPRTKNRTGSRGVDAGSAMDELGGDGLIPLQ